MADTAQYIGDLNIASPADSESRKVLGASDRQIKKAAKQSFPYVTGEVTATHTELSYTDGVTSNIQTQLNTKGAHAGQTWTGAHDYTGATIAVAPATLGSQPYTKTQTDALVISATAPSWSATTTATSKTLTAFELCRVTASGQTITFPASPTAGVTRIGVIFAAGITGTLDPNGNKIMESSGTMTVNKPGSVLFFTYHGTASGYVLGA